MEKDKLINLFVFAEILLIIFIGYHLSYTKYSSISSQKPHSILIILYYYINNKENGCVMLAFSGSFSLSSQVFCFGYGNQLSTRKNINFFLY